MTRESVEQRVVVLARAQGLMRFGTYRVVVLESDGRTSSKDFGLERDARSYADDAASESDDEPPLAFVLDSDFKVVGRGRHYALRGDE
ncbi:MAG: hypothetical protein IT371_21665 [Deltaproteobacteria bacterium]|nr:hypothetical protein [Deltaproteobacteria bacterium]